MMSERVNPFATRYTHPGRIAFRFGADDHHGPRHLTEMVDQLLVGPRESQIIGPHGSGKSTLVVALEAELQRRGHQVVVCTLRNGQRVLPKAAIDLRRSADMMVVIDGYEQLSGWQRWKLRRRCRRCDARLLVTAHRDLGWHTVWRTRPSEALLHAIVTDLTDGGPPGCRPSEAEIQEAFASHDGNLRESLFQLYDVVQARIASRPRPEGG